MGKDTIVIADNMNYIKGSRYQMYCQAREIGVRTCTVSLRSPLPSARARIHLLNSRLHAGIRRHAARQMQRVEHDATGRVPLLAVDVSGLTGFVENVRHQADHCRC